MIAGTALKVQCPYCPLSVHKGNVERHERACLARIAAKRRRQTARELREGAAA